MPTQIIVSKLGSAEEFCEHLLKIVHGEPVALCRGQEDQSDLVPSVWRTNEDGTYKIQAYLDASNFRLPKRWHEVLPGGADDSEVAMSIRYAPYLDRSSERLRNLVVWLETEIEFVRDFCGQCDRVALPVPGYADAVARVRISEERRADGWVPLYPLSATFAFAQHNGVPTRLLDFSDSPLKAAYFAVKDVKAKTDFCLWILRRQGENATTTQEFRALRSQIPFLHAQDGVFFSCNAESNRFLLENARWPRLEEVISGWTIEKVVCPRVAAKAVRKWLRDFGIWEATMMPSFSNVAKQVTNKFHQEKSGRFTIVSRVE